MVAARIAAAVTVTTTAQLPRAKFRSRNSPSSLKLFRHLTNGLLSFEQHIRRRISSVCHNVAACQSPKRRAKKKKPTRFRRTRGPGPCHCTGARLLKYSRASCKTFRNSIPPLLRVSLSIAADRQNIPLRGLNNVNAKFAAPVRFQPAETLPRRARKIFCTATFRFLSR